MIRSLPLWETSSWRLMWPDYTHTHLQVLLLDLACCCMFVHVWWHSSELPLNPPTGSLCWQCGVSCFIFKNSLLNLSFLTNTELHSSYILYVSATSVWFLLTVSIQIHPSALRLYVSIFIEIIMNRVTVYPNSLHLCLQVREKIIWWDIVKQQTNWLSFNIFSVT